MASNRSFCDVAGDLAFSHGYKLVLVAKIVICILGILIFGTFMIFKPNRLWHHAHASLLAKYHLASAFILNLGSLGIFVFNLARLSISSSDPCSYLLSSKLQFWLSFLLLFLFFLETISILIVSIERTISTARIASYENFESRRSVIFIILFLSTLLFFALLITILLTPELAVHTGIVIVASSKSFYVRKFAYVLFAIIVVLGIVTVILAQITYLLNVKYRRFYRAGKSRDAEQTNRLSAVFQIEENLSMMRVLLPVSYIHLFIVSFSVAGLLIYDMLGHNAADFVFDTTVKEALLISPLYSIALPAVLFWHYPNVFWKAAMILSRQNFAKEGRQPGVRVVPVALQRDVHFAGLQNAFDGPIPKRTR